MSTLVAVDNIHHKNTRIDPLKAEQYGKNINLLPVVLSEFSQVATQSPIVFTKNGETGQMICSALQGFGRNENLLFANNRWQGDYLPLHIQRQPFYLGTNQDENDDEKSSNDEYTVCLNTDSPSVTTNDIGERIYDDDLNETPYFSQVKNNLINLVQGEQANKVFITALQKLDLIQPLSLEITFKNQDKTRLNGLYTIDQENLRQLPDKDILHLHSADLLQGIYTMIMSLEQIYPLINKKNLSFG